MSSPFVHLELNTPDLAKAKHFYSTLFGWSFVDVFRWLSLLCFTCIGFVWLLKKVKPGRAPAGAH